MYICIEVSHLSCVCAPQVYSIESRHPSGHTVTFAVGGVTIKGAFVINIYIYIYYKYTYIFIYIYVRESRRGISWTVLISHGVRGEHSLIHAGSLGTVNLCERGQLKRKEMVVILILRKLRHHFSVCIKCKFLICFLFLQRTEYPKLMRNLRHALAGI